MEKDKIVCLDIDGTLSSEQWFISNPPEVIRSQIDSNAVKLLNQLIGAKVLIISSWGEDGIEPLKKHGLELPIVGCTKKVHYQHEWACRGNEIEEWFLRTYGGMGTKFGTEYDSEAYDYVIFDDDTDMLLGQIEHFVHVDRRVGLTQEDIDKAKRILKYEL